MRRKAASSPFSLFSFQDIITSVTGIMILITIMLAIEFLQRKESTPPAARQEVVKKLEHELVDLKAEIERYEREVQTQGQDLEELAAFDVGGWEKRLQTAEREIQVTVERTKSLQLRLERVEQLAAELGQQTVQAAPDLEVLRGAESERKAKEQELADIRAGRKLVFNPAKDSHKAAWIVEVRADRTAAAPLERIQLPQIFAHPDAERRARDFQAFARSHSREKVYFVLFLKPGPTEQFIKPIMEGLESIGFEYGLDLLGPQQELFDVPAGVGT